MQDSSPMDSRPSSQVKRFVCIHGHFYQPPRENPWLESVPIEPSAAPFDNWNLRIEAECFRPNTASPILSPNQRVTKVLNNFSHLSFNFGPTLLSWMEDHAPVTYAAILEADKESSRNFSGHGSAIAQAYNHGILPLANRRDKEIQIGWGIRDFERRFERNPEGFWLPETAVDLETLEVLAGFGIRFTVLAPHQAAQLFSSGANQWADAGDNIDTRQPYLLRLASGRQISLFFYNGALSRAVAFEHLLHDGGSLASRLLSQFSPEPQESELSHIATDGETYGHHHRHGDMALSFAFDLIRSEKSVRLTNYGEFLELFPPHRVVRIKEGTSWSCLHGIERWRSDCGCSSGYNQHWNQQWRQPLRVALDRLSTSCLDLYQRQARAFFSDPERAIDHYWSLVAKVSPHQRDEFLSQHARPDLEPPDRTEALRLLDLRRNCQLMFTSCAWFFDDISGIEPVQILRYAARAIHLARCLGGEFEDAFLEDLASARSNLEEKGDGRQIFRTLLQEDAFDSARVAGHVAFHILFELPYERLFQAFQIECNQLDRFELNGARLCSGTLRLERTRTSTSSLFAFLTVYQANGPFRAFLQKMEGSSDAPLVAVLMDRLHRDPVGSEQSAGSKTIDFDSLCLQSRSAILKALTTQLRIEQIRGSESFLEERSDLLQLLGEARQILPAPLPGVLGSVLQENLPRLIDDGNMELLRRKITQARDWGVEFAEDGWADLLGSLFEEASRKRNATLDRTHRPAHSRIGNRGSGRNPARLEVPASLALSRVAPPDQYSCRNGRLAPADSRAS